LWHHIDQQLPFLHQLSV